MPAGLLKTTVADSPVTLAEAKAHLRVPSSITSEDTLITSMLAGANADAEAECGRGFGLSTWKMYLDQFPDGAISLPRKPVGEVTSVKYWDEDDEQQTLDAGDYWVATTTGRIGSKEGWPATHCLRPEAVEVVWTAGHTSGNLPAQGKQAILIILAARWMNRGDDIPTADPTGSSQIPAAARRLLSQLWSGEF